MYSKTNYTFVQLVKQGVKRFANTKTILFPVNRFMSDLRSTQQQYP